MSDIPVCDAGAVAAGSEEMNNAYADYLGQKRLMVRAHGPDVPLGAIHPILFPFQRDLTRWALRKGTAAIFADTGLGKTFMQVEWARLLGHRTLIVAPLSVARQTVAEAKKIGVKVYYTRDGSDVTDGLNITNYEMVDKFAPEAFGAVVLDESSILKAIGGKTRAKLTAMFAKTSYKLCCTATPAPNDIAEIANHAEFLGIMTRAEMLAAFFIHDSDTSAYGGWRLKGHAEDGFYRWLASWSMSLTKPSDLGYDDTGYILPELRIEPVWVVTDYTPEGQLMSTGLRGIGERSKVRQATLRDRVTIAAGQINATTDQWIAWCGLNEEGRLLHRLVPDSVLMEGAQPPEDKLAAIEGFQDGTYRVLVTKPRIAGFGMNFQQCARMAFVGLSDSWEAYYQCIRRCWRFGQTRSVEAKVVLSEAERPIYANVMAKEQEAQRMRDRLLEHVHEFERTEITVGQTDAAYETDTVQGDGYTLMLGDCVERLGEIENDSVDLSIFSPPFLSLYTYTPTERDLGNSRSEDEFFRHFGFVIDHLLRVVRPGRNCAVHVSQVPARLMYDGYIGIKDFRGDVIRAFANRGWIYHGEVCIDKDPQVQAIRSHAKQLLFAQLRKDAAWLAPAYADYILIFRKPGENLMPVNPDITNDQWIQWARPVWYGINATNTLNAAEGREQRDERHVAPLQLDTIERCLRLWSNPGEVILSPFAGIGSEGYVAIKHKRRFIGIELKRSYFETARKNLERALWDRKSQMLLFHEESRTGTAGANA